MSAGEHMNSIRLALQLIKSFPTSESDVKIWLSDVENVMISANLSWEELLKILPSKIDVAARKWFENNRQSFTSLTVLKTGMLENYNPTPAELISKFNSNALGPSEDVRHYHDRFQNDLINLDLQESNPIVIDAFINGLGPLGIAARLARCTTVREAMLTAQHVQGTMRKTGGTNDLGAMKGLASLLSPSGNTSNPTGSTPSRASGNEGERKPWQERLDRQEKQVA